MDLLELERELILLKRLCHCCLILYGFVYSGNKKGTCKVCKSLNFFGCGERI